MAGTLKITGNARILAPRDMVRISFTSSVQQMDYARAVAGLDNEAARLADIITKAGFERSCLKTSNFDVTKKSEYNQAAKKNCFAGFEASQDMSLDFAADTGKISSILSALSSTLKDTEFTLSFYCGNPGQYEPELLGRSIKDARAKAEAIAGAAGVRLGGISQIDYSYSTIEIEDELKMSCLGSDAAGSCMQSEINPEDARISRDITVVWVIE